MIEKQVAFQDIPDYTDSMMKYIYFVLYIFNISIDNFTSTGRVFI